MKKIGHEEAQKIELEILTAFAEYCKTNGLRYFLAYGTLIGAVRHQGFIPWDNDVDVVMPRPDYERLISLTQDQPIAEHLHVLDYRKERTFPFAKVVDTRTVCKEHFLVTEENMGIYIDIFPMDGMPDSPSEQKKIFRKNRIFNKLYALTNYRFNTGSTPVVRLIKNVLYPVSRLVSSRWVCEKMNGLGASYSYDQSDFVATIVWGYGDREVVPRAYFEPTTGNFEKREFVIPVSYDALLTQLYGDYMQLPPEEARFVHEFEAYWKD